MWILLSIAIICSLSFPTCHPLSLRFSQNIFSSFPEYIIYVNAPVPLCSCLADTDALCLPSCLVRLVLLITGALTSFITLPQNMIFTWPSPLAIMSSAKRGRISCSSWTHQPAGPWRGEGSLQGKGPPFLDQAVGHTSECVSSFWDISVLFLNHTGSLTKWKCTEESSQFLGKGPGRKYFRLCGPYGLCCNSWNSALVSPKQLQTVHKGMGVVVLQ